MYNKQAQKTKKASVKITLAFQIFFEFYITRKLLNTLTSRY